MAGIMPVRSLNEDERRQTRAEARSFENLSGEERDGIRGGGTKSVEEGAVGGEGKSPTKYRDGQSASRVVKAESKKEGPVRGLTHDVVGTAGLRGMPSACLLRCRRTSNLNVGGLSAQIRTEGARKLPPFLRLSELVSYLAAHY